jgi:ATP phosphoribosyltransferase
LAGVPEGASAVAANVTVTDTTQPSYLTVYPGGTMPTASNLNWAPGATVANLVIGSLSSQGSLTVFNQSGSADVVVDVVGYYTAAGGTGTEFNALTSPTRICDTRAGQPTNQCSGKTLTPGSSLTIQVTGLAGVPQGALAVVVNITATDTTAPSYFTVYPGGSLPLASSLNWAVGETVPNLVVAALSPTGAFTVYNNQGSADLVVDVLGWYS